MDYYEFISRYGLCPVCEEWVEGSISTNSETTMQRMKNMPRHLDCLP
jgi:hypothetical protein